jgi:hypothetical protein
MVQLKRIVSRAKYRLSPVVKNALYIGERFSLVVGRKSKQRYPRHRRNEHHVVLIRRGSDNCRVTRIISIEWLSRLL